AGRSNHLVMDDTAGQIQVQLKSDHQHSSLSLGHITRIEDHQGRKDQRGDGFELRTDGHGVARAAEGLLISTEARDRAQGHVKDMREALARMTQARDHHETLAQLAEHHNAQDKDEDQSAVSKDLKSQTDAIRGAGEADAQAGRFPELSQPHLVISSAAGIGATASGNVALDARSQVAITSGSHTSIASTKSILGSAFEAIRMFAYERGIRIFAAKGPVQVQAQDDQIELTAQKAIELVSANDWIHLNAKEGISLTAQGSTFRIDGSGFSFRTPASHHVWAATHQTFGPDSVQALLPELPRSECLTCMLNAAVPGNPFTRL
ncbi:type VI secretion system Vgr family protein, partial [Variovorax dokdonensis]